MEIVIVTTSARPELAAITGRWRWEAFFRDDGTRLEDMLAAERIGAKISSLLPTTFVMLADDDPVGMASLVERDLEDRPDLTPWLAGVYVIPEARGRGHATRLIHAVEGLANEEGITTLWLYTASAVGLYQRLGWTTVEKLHRLGKQYTLMRRDLIQASDGQ